MEAYNDTDTTTTTTTTTKYKFILYKDFGVKIRMLVMQNSTYGGSNAAPILV